MPSDGPTPLHGQTRSVATELCATIKGLTLGREYVLLSANPAALARIFNVSDLRGCSTKHAGGMTVDVSNRSIWFISSPSAIIYFAILSALFRLRAHIGIGAFFCALGVMHFLETYLASVFYVALPFGIVTSPGSTVLFTGKLMLLLLVYIREDAVVVRQPIYGLLVGNLLMVVLAYLMRNHALMALAPDRVADLGFLDEMGALMVWGTGILFIDCILIILLYERSRVWFGTTSSRASR